MSFLRVRQCVHMTNTWVEIWTGSRDFLPQVKGACLLIIYHFFSSVRVSYPFWQLVHKVWYSPVFREIGIYCNLTQFPSFDLKTNAELRGFPPNNPASWLNVVHLISLFHFFSRLLIFTELVVWHRKPGCFFQKARTKIKLFRAIFVV